MDISVTTQLQQYLTFTLDEEAYAIDVARVREILELPHITKMPRMPRFMRGVLNLRGNVVPVIDLRLVFGLSSAEDSVDTCIIIVEVRTDNETVVLGSLADSVQEVIDLGPEQIEPPPKIGIRLDTDFIRGMGKHDKKFLTILDIDRVFTSDEMAFAPELPAGIDSEAAAVLQQ